MSSNKKEIVYEEQGHLAKITLNRPEAANALSLSMLDELSAVCERLAANAEIRVVVLSSAGDRIFCAGADLKERSTMSEDEARLAVKKIGATIEMVADLPQPVIADANGSALGGGLELCMACDLRVFAETAFYGLTETSLAIIPGAGGTQRLPRLIGEGRAKAMIYSSSRISGAMALNYGLCEYAVVDGGTTSVAMELGHKIAENGPIAVQAAKQAIDKGSSLSLKEALKQEQEAYELTLKTKDRLEGLTAFKEKRQARYQGH